MLRLVALAGCGALGTLCRYWLSGVVHRCFKGAFPLGTLAVNLAGCFCVGVLMYFVRDRQLLNPDARVLLIVGFLGAFTTFSAFGYETLELLRGGSFGFAALNVAGNVLRGLSPSGSAR